MTKSSRAARGTGQHNAGHHRPPNQREDDGDGKVDARDVPITGQRRRQPHPQWNRGDRTHNLDDALDHIVHDAAVQPRKPAQQHAEEEAEHHAHQADGHRDTCSQHQARPQVTDR
ncbi:MAG: hypothetical protein R2856_19360 [Caldilineaceae bacterium]